jgi:hypothetical protein
VWLDYVLVIPAELYSENVLSEEPVDNTGTFIKECGHNHFFMDNFTKGRTFKTSYLMMMIMMMMTVMTATTKLVTMIGFIPYIITRTVELFTD